MSKKPSRLGLLGAGICWLATGMLSACNESAPGAGEKQVVIIDDEVTGASPVHLSSIEIESDRSLIIHYTSGVEPCYAAARAEAEYGENKIFVRVFEGTGPDAGPQGCPDKSLFKTLRMQLDYPIEGREVIPAL